ncbi:MAG: Riboflavin synthase [candidate division BRC1 bacterium ADurb.BinA292]|nr:MAG: Riboflavin synthase [candidate division BRC1 bacterium ADurb.BinA292]
MFTGIIESVGVIRERLQTGGGLRLVVQPDRPLDALRAGESIAVNGVCLTAEASSAPDQLSFFLSPETRRRSTLGDLPLGALVNLERALRAEDRLGGHLVLGHVDAVGRIRRFDPQGESWLLEVGCPRELEPFLAPKGSIALDGISLTMVETGEDWFTVAVIPHTAQATTLRRAVAGDAVNLEVDLLARYVVRALATLRARESGLSLQLLNKAGFLPSA